jgi:aminoglycoside phosphotransferase family enzyme
MEIARLISALAEAAAYPFPVAKVEVRQTHISVVFLTGEVAYKIKKPVNLGFVDFSTLEKRRHFCEEEVRLNRRLAPAVYLGVVPITQTGSGLHFEGAGETQDWAVKMKRLPDSATIHERLQRGEITVTQVEALARRLASFHQGAERGKAISAFGRFEVVAQVLGDVFKDAASQVGITVSRPVFERLQRLIQGNLVRLRPLIDSRAERGMTCDTHGDLHLDHVYLFPERPPPDDLVIVDCIEFNERFR